MAERVVPMMRHDAAMRAFVIHLAVFVTANLGFAILNLLRNPHHIWFIWVMAGWGIGLAAHDLALLLKRMPRRAIFRNPAVRGFFIHAFVYLGVNTLLIVANFLSTPRHYWFYWPLLGCGVPLVAHGYVVLARRKPSAKRRPTGRARAGASK